MGVPTQDSTVPQSTPAESTPAHQPPTQHAIVPADRNGSSSPFYEQDKSPGLPRSDDPAHAEMAYNAVPYPSFVTPLTDLTVQPATIDCPFCCQQTQTDVRKTESDTTWMYTLLCCLCCGCIGAIFPLMLGWGNDFEHWCRFCGNRVARVPHEGDSGGVVRTYGPLPGDPVAPGLPVLKK